MDSGQADVREQPVYTTVCLCSSNEYNLWARVFACKTGVRTVTWPDCNGNSTDEAKGFEEGLTLPGQHYDHLPLARD